MRRLLRAAWLGGWLGVLAGALEALEVGFTARLSLALGEGVLLGAVACGIGGLLGAGLGAVAALATAGWVPRRVGEARAMAWVMALATIGLGAFYLDPVALRWLRDGRAAAALALGLFPVGLGGVIYFNASYWLRREEVAGPPRVRWWMFSLAVAALLVGVGAGTLARPPGPSDRAVPDDPPVLLITIDTLRRDHVSIYGEGRAHTPAIDGLAAEGITFLDAVTPQPETGPAHASMLTGLHPIVHGMLSNGHRLTRGYRTLPEILREEGYATAAFVSSFAVDSRTGLDQGFQIYEDDFFPAVRGFSELSASSLALRLLMAFGHPEDFPWLLERKGAETARLAARWIRANAGGPWFAWVHFMEPHAPYEGPDAKVDHRALLSQPDHVYTPEEIAELRRLYAGEVEEADRQVGVLLDTLDELGLADKALVIVTADHGEQLGEHDIWFQHHGLYDESVRIPMVVRAPGLRPKTRQVEAQVRLNDVVATVLDWIKVDVPEGIDSVDLLDYARGVRHRSLATTLYGRREASFSRGTLLGLRTGDVKYILDPDRGVEELYDLRSDPAESDNLAGDERFADPLERARGWVARWVRRGEETLPPSASAEANERLRALGYVE